MRLVTVYFMAWCVGGFMLAWGFQWGWSCRRRYEATRRSQEADAEDS